MFNYQHTLKISSEIHDLLLSILKPKSDKKKRGRDKHGKENEKIRPQVDKIIYSSDQRYNSVAKYRREKLNKTLKGKRFYCEMCV